MDVLTPFLPPLVDTDAPLPPWPADQAGRALLLAALGDHGLAPLFDFRLRERGAEDLPDADGRAALRAARQTAAARTLGGATCARRVFAALAQASVPAVLLKGASWRPVWPDPALRPGSDLDLLLKPEDRERAARALAAAGYGRRRTGPSTETWTSLRDEERELTLDVKFGLREAGCRNPTFHPPMARWWEAALPLAEPAGASTLAPAHALLYGAAHASDHAYTRLLWLVDLALALRAWPEAARPEPLEDQARACRARKALALTLHLVRKLFGPWGACPGPLPAPRFTGWLARRVADHPASWGEETPAGWQRLLLRACLVDRPRDLLRAACGLSAGTSGAARGD